MSQEGHAFGRRRAAILRPTRQAGQLPGRGQPLDRQRRGELADSVPAVSAGDLANDPERRRKAKNPDNVVFQTKPAIALDQIRAAQASGVAPGVVLADAGYGADGAFRTGLSVLGLAYAVGVQPTLSVWRPGDGPLPPKPWRGKGPTSLMRRSPEHSPVSAKALAQELPQDVCRRSKARLRQGSRPPLRRGACVHDHLDPRRFHFAFDPSA
ncbi:hypothetical protein CPY51_11315 [Rhizobium tubonense]|uniref:Transposase IS701-like DDE domain-containing protein n=1 Tax=Rhizobium tubonense TaxID=484088 RepID=A0A2W4DBM0_9HYPH|nr:hypothetical protein CPY51_11315 [Rhizobium tubonense]